MSAVAAWADTVSGRVVGVTDGDTIKVLENERTQHVIRLAGIDAPERGMSFGSRSKQHLSALVFAKEVTVEIGKVDRYGRSVGKIIVNGQDANLAMIEAGLAWHYKAYQGEQTQTDRLKYAEAEELARQTRKGLWLEVQPVPPWVWRKRGQE